MKPFVVALVAVSFSATGCSDKKPKPPAQVAPAKADPVKQEQDKPTEAKADPAEKPAPTAAKADPAEKPAPTAAKADPAAKMMPEIPFPEGTTDRQKKQLTQLRDGYFAFNEGKTDKLDTFSDDVTWYAAGVPGSPFKGKAAVQAFLEASRQMSSDLTLSPQNVYAGDNVVAVHVITSGTDDGGSMGKPATKKKFGADALHIFRWTGDRISEVATYVNQGTMLVQLGHMPGQAAPPVQPDGGSPKIFVAAASPGVVDAEKAVLAAFNKGDLAWLKANYYADGFTGHDHFAGYAIPSAEAAYKNLAGYMAAFPGIQMTEQKLWAVGDVVISETVAKGTHKGALGPIEATGKDISTRIGEILAFKDGKATSQQIFGNSLELLGQLGLLQAGAGGGAGDAPAMDDMPEDGDEADDAPEADDEEEDEGE